MTDDRHEHEWTRAKGADGIRAWACNDCDETCATCTTCGGPSGTTLLLCRPCERHAARVLDDITHALGYYRTDPRSLISSPGNMRLAPGGTPPGGITRPADVREQLWGWVARWTEHTGPSNASAIDYLKAHHIWAAHNPDDSGWPAYLKDAKRLRTAARRIAGLLPQFHPEPCVHCGGPVVQDWSDPDWKPLPRGLSDTVRCLGCGMTWADRAQWRFSTRQHIVELPGVRPDSLVTLAQARMVWPDVPAGTLRQWAKRARDEWADAVGMVRTWWAARCDFGGPEWVEWARAGWTEDMLDDAPDLPAVLMRQRGTRRGEPTYRVGDVHALVERWADERRAGRAPSVATRRA
ncbi:hypothetical protein OEB99_16610 [Actinotalea sp. M2MS4P-6]|uniref:hypothetical protein n=1 Tax=Actinotalea sp. M2MS4P-6 TaxID=2983762 RepID=UPI0021E46453|nr:hypothetical protein [Actinotalea sp. M2MS4P-6]MCV2395939.1 hypothetical protein [Actinotalea sp. M2MS4P-6]